MECLLASNGEVRINMFKSTKDGKGLIELSIKQSEQLWSYRQDKAKAKYEERVKKNERQLKLNGQ